MPGDLPPSRFHRQRPVWPVSCFPVRAFGASSVGDLYWPARPWSRCTFCEALEFSSSGWLSAGRYWEQDLWKDKTFVFSMLALPRFKKSIELTQINEEIVLTGSAGLSAGWCRAGSSGSRWNVTSPVEGHRIGVVLAVGGWWRRKRWDRCKRYVGHGIIRNGFVVIVHRLRATTTWNHVDRFETAGSGIVRTEIHVSTKI